MYKRQSLTLGTGHALYCSMFAPGRVSVAFFGDGGGNQGAFHEALNLAALWKLPVIFVCENNHYAISTSVESVSYTHLDVYKRQIRFCGRMQGGI